MDALGAAHGSDGAPRRWGVAGAEGVGRERYWPMVLGGVLALAAVAFFALTVLRATRQGPPDIVLHERIGP